MDYQAYTAEDFVLDQKFRQWVLHPDTECNLFWEKWLMQHPEKAAIIEEARELLLDINTHRHILYDEEENAMWKVIARQISEKEDEIRLNHIIAKPHVQPVQPANTFTKQIFWTHTRIGKVAASVSILLSLGLAFYFMTFSTSTPAKIPQAEIIQKENPWGQRSSLVLSDGTKVTLNAGSSLSYEKVFALHERVVTLKGEAFFQVAEDKKRPFKVKTKALVTEALGTSFNVNAYDSVAVEVALVTGKVSVQRTHNTSYTDNLLLVPGESATYDAQARLTKSQFDARKVLSWKDGIIYFDHAGEKTVFRTLEQWYGVSITVMNTTRKEWKYAASFDNRSLEHVLMSISFAMDFQYTIDGKKITIQYN